MILLKMNFKIKKKKEKYLHVRIVFFSRKNNFVWFNKSLKAQFKHNFSALMIL